MSDYTVKQAVRAFIRIWAPISVAMDEWAQADMQIDAGEFSGSFHDDSYDRAFNKNLESVAKRFEVTTGDMIDEMYNQDHDYIQYQQP